MATKILHSWSSKILLCVKCGWSIRAGFGEINFSVTKAYLKIHSAYFEIHTSVTRKLINIRATLGTHADNTPETII